MPSIPNRVMDTGDGYRNVRKKIEKMLYCLKENEQLEVHFQLV